MYTSRPRAPRLRLSLRAPRRREGGEAGEGGEGGEVDVGGAAVGVRCAAALLSVDSCISGHPGPVIVPDRSWIMCVYDYEYIREELLGFQLGT